MINDRIIQLLEQTQSKNHMIYALWLQWIQLSDDYSQRERYQTEKYWRLLQVSYQLQTHLIGCFSHNNIERSSVWVFIPAENMHPDSQDERHSVSWSFEKQPWDLRKSKTHSQDRAFQMAAIRRSDCPISLGEVSDTVRDCCI